MESWTSRRQRFLPAVDAVTAEVDFSAWLSSLWWVLTRFFVTKRFYGLRFFG